ncbi:hypothetical protein N7497_012272 [Penicillium chrysogenum]|uniref:Serine/threonine-protein kinase n=1 Tax=Penicillium chrysogenum TaxID=5076 RepID=A0ABQ8W9P1_PENCH|nr:hypothetical protein N7505_009791 [Penicillium chrysogenum]KAJ6137020.1 hypothetical protein N7497_012272 [Penicillium chrysogenum]
MWSVGCILIEMILGKFILITELLGKLSEEVIKRVYSKSTLEFVDSLLKKESFGLIYILRDTDP